MMTLSATLRAVCMSCVDDQASHLMVAAGAQDQFVDDVAHDRVQAGGRLIVEHEFGVQNQGPGQADPLAHAARKLRRLF